MRLLIAWRWNICEEEFRFVDGYVIMSITLNDMLFLFFGRCQERRRRRRRET
jgi:hypothetical protein